MPQSSPNNPLPVVATLERLSHARFNGLRGHYHGLLLNKYATIASIDKFYHALMVGIFHFLGCDGQRYQECFSACMNLCKSTKVFQARSWSSWSGFTTFLNMMEKAERLTRHTSMLHCPSAPYLVVAIAMQQITLNMPNRLDKVCRFFSDFHCHSNAATVIYFFELNYRQDVLTLDQVWDLTPQAVQRAPNRTIHQLEAIALDHRMTNPRYCSTREATQLKVTKLNNEQFTVKSESPAANQAPEFREERREGAMPVPVQVRVPTPITMPMPMPVPVPVPVSVPMPASVSSPAPTMARETLKEVFRKDVMTHLQPLLDRLKRENWNGVLQSDIMQVLTDKNVRVLPGLAKHMLNMWATRSQNTMLLSWLEQARDDVDVFQWTERYAEPAPSAWTNPQSVHAVFHDIDAMIMRIPQLEIRDPLQAKMSMLRDLFDQQEKSHKDEMLFRVDSLRMDIEMLHDQMAESKQTDVQATSGLAAVHSDAAEAHEGVIVIETDEDTAEDLEAERKGKKRKGEKKVVKIEKKDRKKEKKNGEETVKKKEEKAKSGEKIKKKKRSHEEVEED